jgi:hypothetical protein
MCVETNSIGGRIYSRIATRSSLLLRFTGLLFFAAH